MAISFHILPHRGLVHVRYSGKILFDETGRAFSDYVTHPDYRPGQMQLIDLGEVIDWERDFPKLLNLQARKAEAFHQPTHSTMVVAIAPSECARRFANFVGRSWDAIDSVAYLVADSEAKALALLGFAATSVSQLEATR